MRLAFRIVSNASGGGGGGGGREGGIDIRKFMSARRRKNLEKREPRTHFERLYLISPFYHMN